ADVFVAGFIGSPPMNLLPGEVVAPSAGGPPVAVVSGGTVRVGAYEPGRRVTIGIRPEHLVVADAGTLEATVSLVESLGHERLLACRLPDTSLVIVRQGGSGPPTAIGTNVRLGLAEDAQVHVFDRESGRRIDAAA
ncbi:MAG TPA: TOBE domain-containing protein, partial [Acidimicrobiales bacterium]|nr:TOBE domain-containing protein [Acidimicrobiales bacterium]